MIAKSAPPQFFISVAQDAKMGAFYDIALGFN